MFEPFPLRTIGIEKLKTGLRNSKCWLRVTACRKTNTNFQREKIYKISKRSTYYIIHTYKLLVRNIWTVRLKIQHTYTYGVKRFASEFLWQLCVGSSRFSWSVLYNCGAFIRDRRNVRIKHSTIEEFRLDDEIKISQDVLGQVRDDGGRGTVSSNQEGEISRDSNMKSSPVLSQQKHNKSIA